MMNKNIALLLRGALLSAAVLLQAGCTIIDKKVAVVQPFDAQNYLGKWYEIARLDHSFERGLTQVTAEYQQDGDAIKVINRGYDPQKKAWKSAEGIAYFTDGAQTGRLKVSFFRPFYGAYQIHAIIPEQPSASEPYQVSLVIGPDTDYMWLLARSPSIDEATKQQLLTKAKALGIDTQQIIWVEQTAATH